VILAVVTRAESPNFAEEHKYLILATLDFDSDRKRMSTIVQYPDGKIYVICKGADNIIRDRLKQRDSPMVLESQHQADDFAEQGLRTLFVAQREISEADSEKWLENLKQAKLIAGGAGDKAVEEAQATFESEMTLVGVTAIEDKLQRNVGLTLSRLRDAGIKTWVLTGDKVGTAVNIGFACELLTQDMEQVYIKEKQSVSGKEDHVNSAEEIVKMAVDAKTKAEELSQEQRDSQKQREVALIIEAAALDILGIGLGEDDLATINNDRKDELQNLQDKFIESCQDMTAVLCCRVSPKQKADLTELVKKKLNKVTLGIGDGANDVGMIINAHVGVGIQGVEGSQAVNNSDFSLTEFQHLGNLLLVHGRWTYRRIASATCYFFYKSVSFCMTLVWYTFYSGFGGNYFYNTWLTTLWSPIFTVLPVVVYALLEQDVSYHWSLKCPSLYEEGPSHAYLNTKLFLLWIGNAFYDSLIIFFATWFSRGFLEDGRTTNFDLTGVLMYAEILVVVTVRLAIQTQYYPWITWVSYIGSVVLYFVYLLFECAIVGGVFTTGLYWTFYNLISQIAFFWLTSVMVCTAALLPAYVYKSYQILFVPTKSHRVQRQWAEDQKKKKKQAKERSEFIKNQSADEKERRRTQWKGVADDGMYTATVNPNAVLSGQIKLTQETKKTINAVRVVSRLKSSLRKAKHSNDSENSASSPQAGSVVI